MYNITYMFDARAFYANSLAVFEQRKKLQLLPNLESLKCSRLALILCVVTMKMYVDLYLLQFQFPKSGWTGVLAASRYGFANIVRELFGCDNKAVKDVQVHVTCL